MSRFMSWFATKNGRRFTRGCVGAASLIVFGSQMAFQGPLLDRVVEVCQTYEPLLIEEEEDFYKPRKPRPLPSTVNGLIAEVLQDSNLKEEQKQKLRFFNIVGYEMFHAGGLDSPWGAIVGIPFTFQDVKDIDFNELKIRGKDTLDWILEAPDLADALAITDKAKKFAIMKEIYSCNFVDSAINALIGAGCVLLPARFAAVMNVHSNAFERFNLGKRCSRYFLFYVCGFIMYRCLKDPLKHLSAQKSDKLAAETSPDYLDAGIEYYQKLLERNKVLGELINSSLKTVYDKNGNEHSFFLTPKLPITKRLELLQDMKKETMASAKN